MKSIIRFTLTTILAVLTFNSAWANQDVAQCIHTENKLQISGLVRTGRGTEFFVWFVKDFDLNKVVGNYQGSEIMNLIDQMTLPKKFQMAITGSEIQGEVNIAIAGSDLTPLSQKTDFKYHCKIIAY